MQIKIILAIFVLVSSAFAGANDLIIKSDKIHGALTSLQFMAGDSLEEIARLNDLAYDEIIAANPNIDVGSLQTGDILTIPSQRLVIANDNANMVVSLQERRLYFSNNNIDESYPVAIGREGWHTPVGLFSVIGKQHLPSWHVPKDIIAEFAEQDITLPAVVPPGPDNPLGDYLIRLSMPSYLIHSTNDTASIGKETTSGCISLYPEDIEKLYKMVAIGDNIKIADAPIKWYRDNSNLCVEVHPMDLNDKNIAQINKFKNKFTIIPEDQDYWDSIFADSLGVPQCITIRGN